MLLTQLLLALIQALYAFGSGLKCHCCGPRENCQFESLDKLTQLPDDSWECPDDQAGPLFECQEGNNTNQEPFCVEAARGRINFHRRWGWWGWRTYTTTHITYTRGCVLLNNTEIASCSTRMNKNQDRKPSGDQVEVCWCKNKDGCNSANNRRSNGILSLLACLVMIFATAFKM